MRTEPLAAGPHGNRPAPQFAQVSGAQRSPRWADPACLAALGLAWIVMILMANPIGDFPLNDDWVYGLSVKWLLEHGEFRLPSSASTNLLPQAYWGALFCLPFGYSYTALRISTLVLGLIGVWATFATLRELGAVRRLALLAAALVASNPVYFALSNTFMTDVPFYAVSAVSLYFLVRWTFHMRPRDALLGLAFSMVAILIRQAGIVLPLGFGLAYVVVRGPGLRTIAVAAIPLLTGALLHFGFQAWLHSTGATPAGEVPVLATVLDNLRNPSRVPARLLIFLVYIGIFLLPLLAVLSRSAWRYSDTAWRRTSIAVFAAALVVCGAGVVALGRPMPIIDNVLNGFGAGPLTLTDSFFLGRNLPVVPPWLAAVWNLLSLASIIGAALLLCVVAYGVRSVRSRALSSGITPAIALIGGSFIAYTLLAALALRFFYDRYVLFLLLSGVLFLGAIAAGLPSERWTKRANVLLVLAVLLQAAFAAVATRDYLEWNRTRWAATTELLAGGVPRTSIDGGYEFNGWLGYDPAYERKQGKSPWWVVDDEYMVASGPMPGFSVFRTYPFRRMLTGQNSTLLILRRDPPK